MMRTRSQDQSTGRDDGRRPLAVLFVVLLAALTMMAAFVTPANAEVAKVGPIDPENGYPYWYEDANGLRLDLCLDNTEASKCLRPFELPAERPADLPADAIRFPDYFPGESFWWTGDAALTLPNGSDAQLGMALEGAFANEEVKDGDQMSFGRIRIRIDGLEAGEQYRISHPFGTKTFTAEPIVDGSAVGEINVTEDIGCFPTPRTPCDFNQALSGKVGPFLTWDTFGDPALAPPAGYVGDPDVPHKVTGSIVNDDAGQPQNYFKIEKANEDGTFEQLGFTDEFAVTGKLAELQVGASPARDTVFNDPNQNIEFVASDPAAQVYYTTDGTEPTPETGTLYNGPFAPPSEDGASTTTAYRFVAVKDGQSSEIEQKTYTVDRAAPNVTAESVDFDAAADAVVSQGAGSFDKPQKVTLRASEAADIFYTTDGSDPADENNAARKTIAYDPGSPDAPEPILVERSQEIRAIAVDGAGNTSQPRTFDYSIAAVAEMGPINPQGGYPFWYQDHNGIKLEECLDNSATSKCLVPFEMPNPDAAMTFPENYPGEAFWWTGQASTTLNNGSDALLDMALEAAFANEEPVGGDQMSFGRIRIRIDGLEIGREYKITHPYGVDTFTAEDDGKGAGEINSTVDIGCFPGPGAPCDFNEARFGRVGPFLSWTTFGQGTDPALADAAGNPDRYVGDPNVEHAVKGSPYDTNFFRIEQVNANGSLTRLGNTDQFAVSGKLAEFQAGVNRKGGSFNKAQTIELGASEANSEIFYTLDGTEPTPETGTPYTGPFTLNGDTTLKFKAYGPVPTDGSPRAETPVYTEVYTIDNVAPVVTADPAGFRFTQGNPRVTLSANEDAEIYYTTNGINPAVGGRSTTLYSGPINIDKTTTLKFMAIDKAGNTSGIVTETYTDGFAPQVSNLDLAASSDTGVSNTDNLTRNTSLTINGTAEAGSTVRILVNGSQKASVTAAADGAFSAGISGLQPGANQITAVATDVAGNEGSASGSLNVTVDTEAPAAPKVNPAAGTYTTAQQVSLGIAEGARVFYTTNGSEPTAASAQFTANSAPIQVSRNTTIRAVSIDDAGNSAAASFEYRINTAAPTVTTIAPFNANTRDRTPVIRATVLDRDRALSLADISLRVDGAAVADNLISYNPTSGALSYTPRRALAFGNVPVVVRVTDAPRPDVVRNWSFTIIR